jgi:hypothetical protein
VLKDIEAHDAGETVRGQRAVAQVELEKWDAGQGPSEFVQRAGDVVRPNDGGVGHLAAEVVQKKP